MCLRMGLFCLYDEDLIIWEIAFNIFLMLIVSLWFAYFIDLFVCGARNQTQGAMHARICFGLYFLEVFSLLLSEPSAELTNFVILFLIPRENFVSIIFCS